MIVLAFLRTVREIIANGLGVLFGVVDEMPFGLEPAFQMFSDTLAGITLVIPLIAYPLTLLIWAIYIKISLLLFRYFMYVISLLRG